MSFIFVYLNSMSALVAKAGPSASLFSDELLITQKGFSGSNTTKKLKDMAVEDGFIDKIIAHFSRLSLPEFEDQTITSEYFIKFFNYQKATIALE